MLEVGDDVVHVLAADRDPDKIVAVRPDQGEDIAKADGVGAELQLIGEPVPLLDTTAHAEREHAAISATGQTLGQLVAGMRLQPGVVDQLDFGLALQEPSNLHGVLAMTLHSELQCLDAT